MKTKLPSSTWFIAVFAPGIALASSVIIANPSFESPVLVPNGSTNGSVPGWTVEYSGNLGVYYPVAPEFPLGAPAGLNVGWVSQAGLSQTLADILQTATSYELRLMVGRWEIDTAEQYTVSLKAGATTLASFSESLSAIPRHTFVERVLTYTSTGTEPDLGQPLKIVLEKNSFREVDFDSVRLDATTVPEPAAFSLVGVSGLLLASRRKRLSDGR